MTHHTVVGGWRLQQTCYHFSFARSCGSSAWSGPPWWWPWPVTKVRKSSGWGSRTYGTSGTKAEVHSEAETEREDLDVYRRTGWCDLGSCSHRGALHGNVRDPRWLKKPWGSLGSLLRAVASWLTGWVKNRHRVQRRWSWRWQTQGQSVDSSSLNTAYGDWS